MTTKLQALVWGIGAGIFEFVAWFVMIPPEQQTEYINWIMEFIPIYWRDDLGLWSKGISRFAAIYAVFKASQSGPKTP